MLHLVMILLTLLSAVHSSCSCTVTYAEPRVCAVRGFSVSVPCSYDYSNPQNIKVTQMLWCSMKSNTQLCRNPPYVYDSTSLTSSDFEYVGNNKSNCTLFIHNVQFNYSEEYKFRFITNDQKERCTGNPGVMLHVSDLKVSLIRLSGNGTLKPGDWLNLTCDVNCTHTSSQFMWTKNNELLNTPGSVLHFPALTLRDSGNYTCTWKTDRTSGSDTISLQVEGVFTQSSSDWGVKYPDHPVCAVRGFSVFIPCTYYYPSSGYRVTETHWCSMNLNTEGCFNPPFICNSSLNTESDFQYAGDDTSNCTLLIRNVQFHYSGSYRFRFITDVTGGKYTGQPGATLQVSDLKVSLIRLSGNGTLKPGDSLNLTCDVNCTHTSSQFMWTKNNELLNTPGSVLHFPALTLRDSGNYTCTWKTDRTSGSDSISLQVEGEHLVQWPVWMIAVMTAGGIFIILLILGAVIYEKSFSSRMSRDDAPAENSGYAGEQIQVKQVPQPKGEVPQQEEVTYASVCVLASKPNNKQVTAAQRNLDVSVIYSTVTIK